MCTDVDRNDKSRICVPGSVRVIGRRQIEMYSRLIHTVDHVEGRLRPGFDALDAFLAHTWAVTVTGAPEGRGRCSSSRTTSARRAPGTAAPSASSASTATSTPASRCARSASRTASPQVRVGATLLYDSDPDEEERETHLKASAFLDAIRRPRGVARCEPSRTRRSPGAGKRVLLVDHQDSFVHTLANYLRQTGAEVVDAARRLPARRARRAARPTWSCCRRARARPADFDVSGTIAALRRARLPVFGVCLGLQGMVEHFGGALGVLDYPMHGKPRASACVGGRLFDGLPTRVPRRRATTRCSRSATSCRPTSSVTAESDDGVVMAIEHRTLPLAAVQFHPESILTLDDEVGLRLLQNMVAMLPAS